MKKSIYVNVSIPVSVPNSNYCWDGKVKCPYVSFPSFAWCGMDMGHPKTLKNGKVKKTLDCLDLKEMK
jgi:hypothetical protein